MLTTHKRAYLLSLIVERSKKCVDFTFTLYFIHIIACAYYYVSCFISSLTTSFTILIYSNSFYNYLLLNSCVIHITQQVPLIWEWWFTQVISSVVMATIGEYLCSRNELQDIPLYTINPSSSGSAV